MHFALQEKQMNKMYSSGLQPFLQKCKLYFYKPKVAYPGISGQTKTPVKPAAWWR